MFKSEFERTTAKYRYDDSENCVRLRKYLKGEAREAVIHLLSNPLNVPKMMGLLEKRFGNPEHIIASLIEKAKRVKSPNLDRSDSIVEFGVAVDALVTNIVSFKMVNYMKNIGLLNELVEKMPSQMRREWYDYRKLQPDYDLQTFQDWMEEKCSSAYLDVKPKASQDEDKPFDKKRRNHTFNAAAEVNSCHNCGMKNHAIVSCFKFNRLNPSEKWKVVREKGLCFKCLQKRHLSANCPKSSPCGLDSCAGSHHRLLHRPDQTEREPRRKEKSHVTPVSAQGQAPSEDPGIRSSISSAVQGIMPIIPVTVNGPRGQETVLALLDTGASFSMLESDVADRLGLTGEVRPLIFNVFGEDIRSNPDSMSVSMQIRGASKNSTMYEIKDVRTITSIGLPSSPLDIVKLKMEFPYLNCVKGTGIPDKKPQMIIGYDNHRLFYPLSTLEDPDEKGPSAHLSRLGWYISGVSGGSNCFFACESCRSDCDSNLHEMMKNFFAVEEAGTRSQVTPSRSKEDQRALLLLEKNTVKIENRWQTCLLWKENNPVLPASKNMALCRLSLMDKKMNQDATFASLCCEKFDDYIRKGYLIPVEDVKEKLEPSKKKWFLPWFFSYHPTKKPRLVFDAAAKAGGTSLNDFLLKGPDMLNSLPEVQMRFRSHFIALTADIREMFHQVKLNPEDWPSQTLLYRGRDRGQPPKEYYMTVLFFGAASLPCSAIFAKNKNAKLFEEKYPAAVRAIVEDFYMDDYLGGAETTSDAILLQQQITEIHASGGFEIVKWNSSSPEVLAAIPMEIQAERDQKILEKGDANLEKSLGMWWSPEEDCFQFKLNFKKIPVEVQEEKRKPTKREVVSFVMAVFDPLGFLSPLKIKALIIIQNIWRSGIGWDEEVSNIVHDRWKNWTAQLESVKDVKIRRKYFSSLGKKRPDMHVFVDASEEAYACAIFFVNEENGGREITVVAGKARVAPLKGMTIPRMELQAALVGSRIATSIAACFRGIYNFGSTVYWSDSKTVLCWLRSETGRFKTFVQTRVGEVLELTDSSHWKWVPTKMNVADDATRLEGGPEFSTSCRWLQGVDFLQLDSSEWPKEEKKTDDVKPEDLEARNLLFAVTEVRSSLPLPEIKRFSSWMRLIRATAAVVFTVRKLEKIGPDHITVSDMKQAQKLWILQAQRDSFSAEFSAVKEGRDLPKNSHLAYLSPVLDGDIIVLGGRIDAAPGISENVKRPPILDPAHPYTKLFLKWIHEIGGHHGQERAISEVRKKFWVIDCRKAVRSTWANCEVCKERKLQPATPEMGPLPSCRLGESHVPFYHCGVDYFGPMQVKVNRSTVKRWGVIFCCMSSRAVHLELADGMDTGEMINVLSRFISVRGAPAHLYCDNGRNFVGAKRELGAALQEWNQDEVHRAMAVKGIEWHFNPPAAPHMGGSYERMIGSAKRILSTMLKSRAPRESLHRTLLFEVMDILNSRPLSYASTDPEDPECITPNHLLRMSCLKFPSLPGVYEEGDRCRSAWKYCQYLADEFWRRWTDECLPIMAKRKTWTEKQPSLKEGDIVIVKDNLVPRSSWKKGLITKTFPGKDNQVRVVDVKVATVKPGEDSAMVKIYRRPATKIIPTGLSTVL